MFFWSKGIHNIDEAKKLFADPGSHSPVLNPTNVLYNPNREGQLLVWISHPSLARGHLFKAIGSRPLVQNTQLKSRGGSLTAFSFEKESQISFKIA